MGINRLQTAEQPRAKSRDEALAGALRAVAKVHGPYRDAARTLRMWNRHGVTARERELIALEFGRLADG